MAENVIVSKAEPVNKELAIEFNPNHILHLACMIQDACDDVKIKSLEVVKNWPTKWPVIKVNEYYIESLSEQYQIDYEKWEAQKKASKSFVTNSFTT